MGVHVGIPCEWRCACSRPRTLREGDGHAQLATVSPSGRRPRKTSRTCKTLFLRSQSGTQSAAKRGFPVSNAPNAILTPFNSPLIIKGEGFALVSFA